MLEISEALQQLLDRTTAQVVHETKSQQVTALKIDGQLNSEIGSAAPWKITWDTKLV